METLIEGHFASLEENLRYLGISHASKKFKVISFLATVTYAIGFNDLYDSELRIDIPQGWSHPKLVESGGRLKTKEWFHQWGIILPSR